MTYSKDLDNKQLTSGDELFMQSSPIHAMVAAFIALPIDKGRGDAIINLSNGSTDVFLQAGVVQTKKGVNSIFGLPEGMAGRRIFLYLFSKFYEDINCIIELSKDKSEFIRLFGYQNPKARILHPIRINFFKALYMRVKFTNSINNKKAGHREIDDFGDCIIAANKASSDGVNYYSSLSYNWGFMFKMAFPVNFKHVRDANKKSEFWNVYVFLIDVLPRIPKGTKKTIEWRVIHRIFMNRYKTKENFKYFFKKTTDEVLKFYPKAKGKIDTDSDKNHLILKYAPPPIKPA